jgi:hypothetical protein
VRAGKTSVVDGKIETTFLDVIAFRFRAIETARLSSGGATVYETRPSERCLRRLGGVMIIEH